MMYKKKFMAWFVVEAVDTIAHGTENPPSYGRPDNATTLCKNKSFLMDRNA